MQSEIIEIIQEARELASALRDFANGSQTLPSEPARTLIDLLDTKLNQASTLVEEKHQNISNQELKLEYFEYITPKASKGTLAWLKTALSKFIDFLKDKPLADVSANNIDRFVTSLAERRLRKQTICVYLSGIRKFFKYLVRHHGFKPIDMDQIQASTYRSLPEPIERLPLTLEEMRKLICATRSIRDRLMILFMFYTGLRVSELVNLRLDDVNASQRLVHIRCGKGGKNRWVKYLADLDVLVELWLNRERPSLISAKNDDHFFISKSGKLSTNEIRKIVNEAAEGAGIQGELGKDATGHTLRSVTPHVIRHTFVYHAKKCGIKLEDIQRMMGHSNSETTLRYGKELPANLFDSYTQHFPGLRPARRPPIAVEGRER